MQVKDIQKLLAPSSGAMMRSSITLAQMPSAFFFNVIEPSKDSQVSQVTLEMKDGYFMASLPDVFQKVLNYKQVSEQFKQRRNMSF